MNKDNYPLVTIGIPTYNRANLIRQTLKSAVSQDYPNIEIIISDNASTDSTAEICHTFSEKHQNIVYFKQSLNHGGTENFNTVLRMATGHYFMWLGDDDWIDKNYISECMKVLLSDPGISIVSGKLKYYGKDDIYLYTGITMNIVSDCNKQRIREYFSEVKHNGIFYGVMPKNLILACGLKNVMGGDLLTVASLLFNGKARTTEACTLHRRRGGMSSNSKNMTKSMSLSLLDYYFPRISVANNVFQHIMFDSVFNRLSLLERLLLSIQCVSYAGIRKILSVLFKKRFIEQSGI